MFMARESADSGQQGQRIDIEREQDLREWARKLDATEEQLREAVQAVGPLASDVEDHLKGSRATTNSERTREALKRDGAG
jgi:ABC-type transporter Mla subunit MlaD